MIPFEALFSLLVKMLVSFQIFVANPNKTKSVTKILARNKEKLIVFLNNFQPERTNDEQFLDEKTYLVKQIQDLKSP